jgi:quercetin dioxygenase-like cupin family protein
VESHNDTTNVYETERRMRHAERPGFHIAELQISPTQEVPWHYHTTVQDTLYVLEGTLRVFLRNPKKTWFLSQARLIRFRRAAHIS